MDERIRLVVLFGGRSAEHDVSRVSARHVLAAAAESGRYAIEPIAITREGAWQRADDAMAILDGSVHELPEALAAHGTDVEPLPTLRAEAERVVVLPLVHGPLGEDGTLQGLLELAGVPYVGSGVLGSALSMDKVMAKQVCALHGIPQAAYLARHADELASDDERSIFASDVAAELGFPAFVKPANMGSSIGVSLVEDRASLAQAIDLALSYDEWILVEEGIDGREIELAVLGNRSPIVSMPGEIRPGAAFYSYDDKYHDGTAEVIVDPELPDDVVEWLRSLAVQTFLALRCEGMARTDFFYEPDGRGVLLNEVNTIPGFTPISMYPQLWERAGIGYGELIDRLVELAIERHDRQRRRVD